MEKATITILGHRATIDRVRGCLPEWLWFSPRKEDYFEVSLAFDKAVNSILSFSIELPVKNYGREEFLEAVREEGERELQRLLDLDARVSERQKRDEARQKDLDSLASQIESMITAP